MMASVSRREAIALPAGLAALHALAVPAAASGPPVCDPDHELLALCRRFASIERRMNRLMVALIAANRAGDEALESDLSAASVRHLPYQQRLLAKVMDLRATTPAGLRAKAEVLASTIQYQGERTAVWEHFAVWSVCRDLLGREPAESDAGGVQ
jgi:hypothetical protein